MKYYNFLNSHVKLVQKKNIEFLTAELPYQQHINNNHTIYNIFRFQHFENVDITNEQLLVLHGFAYHLLVFFGVGSRQTDRQIDS